MNDPKVYTLYNSCFREKERNAQQLMNNPIEYVFNESYIVIQTNCPLFNWITYNKDNYYSLIRLQLLEDTRYESLHPAIHGFKVLSNIMRQHIVFNQELLNAVNDKKQIISHSKCISFHIRMGNYKSDFRDGRIFLYENDVMSFINCPIIMNYSRTPIVLSSDSTYAKSIIMNNTREHRVISSSNKAIHSSHFSFLNKNKGTFGTFLDLLTLSNCNELIGTFGSTFTILASSLMGKLPYLVSKNSTCKQPQGYFYI